MGKWPSVHPMEVLLEETGMDSRNKADEGIVSETGGGNDRDIEMVKIMTTYAFYNSLARQR